MLHELLHIFEIDVLTQQLERPLLNNDMIRNPLLDTYEYLDAGAMHMFKRGFKIKNWGLEQLKQFSLYIMTWIMYLPFSM